MIKSFGNELARLIFEGQLVEDLPPPMQERALYKLQLLNAACSLHDLEIVLGDKLETLDGERSGKHCIRVLRHGRLCFLWKDGHAHEVEIYTHH